MKARWRYLLVFGIAALGLVAFFGHSSDPIITIENESDNTLTKIILSGSGFSQQVGDLPPGEKREVIVRPNGESGLNLAFQVNDRSYENNNLGYLEAEGGYRMKLIVDPNLKIRVMNRSAFDF